MYVFELRRESSKKKTRLLYTQPYRALRVRRVAGRTVSHDSFLDARQWRSGHGVIHSYACMHCLVLPSPCCFDRFYKTALLVGPVEGVTTTTTTLPNISSELGTTSYLSESVSQSSSLVLTSRFLLAGNNTSKATSMLMVV
jgi:hypothetical protein